MKENLIRLFLMLIFASCLACNYNRMKEKGAQSSNTALQMLGKLDYNIVNSSVLGPKCVGCHSHGGGNQGGVNLESYSNIRNMIVRIAFRTLERADMPPRAPLSPDEMTILRNWLENGAPEKYVDAHESADNNLDIGATDWKKISEKIFAKKCLDCHSKPQPLANLDLGSYTETKAKAALIFDRVIVKQDMPLEPYPMLSPRERKVLLNWFNLGMPN